MSKTGYGHSHITPIVKKMSAEVLQEEIEVTFIR